MDDTMHTLPWYIECMDRCNVDRVVDGGVAVVHGVGIVVIIAVVYFRCLMLTLGT